MTSHERVLAETLRNPACGSQRDQVSVNFVRIRTILEGIS